MGSNQSKQPPRQPPRQPPTRKQLIEKQGVLIPPLFAINGNDTARSVSSGDRLPLTPSRVGYLTATHVGQGLLQDFMVPGMWVLAGAQDANTSTTCRVSLPQTSGGGKISFSSSPTASQGSRVELRTGTEGPMHFLASQELFQKRCKLFASVNTAGLGYLGGQLGTAFNHQSSPIKQSAEDADWEEEEEDPSNKIQVQLGSWVPLKRATQSSTNKRQGTTSSFVQPPEHVNGFLSVDMLGSTTVVETQWNINTLESQVSKYFSVQLNNNNGASSSMACDCTDDVLPSEVVSTPPLWLTMTSTPQTSTICLSQMLTFDRINFGIDQRAPKVRNTFAWCAQLEKPNNNNDNDNNGSQFSVAAAWQANRNLAFKVVGSSAQKNDAQHHAVTYAVLFKRWKQPRVTCSVLGRYNFPGLSFLGIGLELETDVLAAAANTSNCAPTSAQVSDQDIPETKAALG